MPPRTTPVVCGSAHENEVSHLHPAQRHVLQLQSTPPREVEEVRVQGDVAECDVLHAAGRRAVQGHHRLLTVKMRKYAVYSSHHELTFWTYRAILVTSFMQLC